MNKIYFSYMVFLLFNSCSSILQERASWNFMQEAELEIGLPIKNNNIYYLSFSCDLEKFNSAPLAIKKSHIKIARNEIELYLVYTLTKEENIDKIKLGKLNTGDYRIYYIDKDKTKYFIKEINIE